VYGLREHRRIDQMGGRENEKSTMTELQSVTYRIPPLTPHVLPFTPAGGLHVSL